MVVAPGGITSKSVKVVSVALYNALEAAIVWKVQKEWVMNRRLKVVELALASGQIALAIFIIDHKIRFCCKDFICNSNRICNYLVISNWWFLVLLGNSFALWTQRSNTSFYALLFASEDKLQELLIIVNYATHVFFIILNLVDFHSIECRSSFVFDGLLVGIWIKLDWAVMDTDPAVASSMFLAH